MSHFYTEDDKKFNLSLKPFDGKSALAILVFFNCGEVSNGDNYLLLNANNIKEIKK